MPPRSPGQFAGSVAATSRAVAVSKERRLANPPDVAASVVVLDGITHLTKHEKQGRGPKNGRAVIVIQL